MENQHRKIKGYRELQQHEIDLMNRIKDHAIATEALVARVQAHLNAQYKATAIEHGSAADIPFDGEEPQQEIPADTEEVKAAKKSEAERISQAEPFRWLAIARTDLQTANMALVRAVAQPSTF